MSVIPDNLILISITEDKLYSIIETCLRNNLPTTTNEQQQINDIDQWFNLQQLSDYLPNNPTKSTIYKWVEAKPLPLIPFHRIRGIKGLCFRKSEIDTWLSDGRRLSKNELEQLSSKILSNQK